MTASETLPDRPRIVGRSGRGAVVFPTPLLLAPMEGVTDRTFRAAVCDLGHVGGASSARTASGASRLAATTITTAATTVAPEIRARDIPVSFPTRSHRPGARRS